MLTGGGKTVGSGHVAGNSTTGRKADESRGLDLVERALDVLKPVVLAAGGLIGFVAFAGSIIVWSRFYSAKVPADQAVAAFPRGELIAIASAILLLFGFVGLLAVVTFFLVERKGRATLTMCRALLVLLAVEGVVAIILVEDLLLSRTILAIELLLLPAMMALWVTFTKGYVKEGGGSTSAADEPESAAAQRRDNQAAAAEQDTGVIDTVGDTRRVVLAETRKGFLGSLVVAIIATVITLLIDGGDWLAPAIGAGLLVLLPNLYVIQAALREDDSPAPRDDDDEEEVVPQPLTRKGVAAFLAMMALVPIIPALVLWEFWLFLSLLAAAILAAGLWRIAVLSDGAFRWYGLAVFISVPLFGTITGMARNLDDPQVQPMALIRESDGPDEAIQGLYVTEADDRIYFATVATQGCSDELVPHSGRLLWVPKSEVVAMSIGPLQDVADAAQTALQMSYSLTPAVETPAGDHVSLTVAEKRTEPEGEDAEPVTPVRRLENVGAAVQPNFGRGLALHPESASPGEIVSLRMSAPNRSGEVHGFGQTREGRTLRLGGIKVSVIKEEAHHPREAEYVETVGGEQLSLQKGRLYTKNDDDDYVELETGSHSDGPRFVKVNDGGVVSIDSGKFASGRFLRVRKTTLTATLAVADQRDWRPEVTLSSGGTVPLKYRLLRQAWHEDHITFQVPPNGATGPVTVECDQLAGQPLLRIPQPPTARIAVRMRPGTQRMVFDSRRSSDDGKIVSRRWSIDGLSRGHELRVAEEMPVRGGRAVRLTVIDNVGQADVAQLRLLRLPGDGFQTAGRSLRDPEEIRSVRGALKYALAEDPTIALELDGHFYGASPRGRNVGLSLGLARLARRSLLGPPGAASISVTAPTGVQVPVRSLAYGASCPLRSASPTGRESRIDVFILSEGVHVAPQRGCRPGQVENIDWRPPASSSPQSLRRGSR